MTEKHMAEIKSMSDAELAAACRVVSRQVNANFLVGDRENRREVLAALTFEACNRGI